MSYLRNAWYVGAWADELPRQKMLTRVLLEERVLMFRDEMGTARALFDRCPHRFAPLSMGRLCENGRVIQCGYHGLQFQSDGECVHNPHGPVPKSARVRSYPLFERHGAIWIWMGDPERADPALIPDFSFLNADDWFVGRDYLEIEANYLLENDNILDLSHIQYLHPFTVGSKVPGAGKTVVEEDGKTVWARRTVRNEILASYMYHALGLPEDAPIDRWLDVRWDAPSLLQLHSDHVPAGRPREDVSAAHRAPSAHLFTPAGPQKTHYFFAIALPKTTGQAGEELIKNSIVGLQQTFQHEDKPMVEAQQRELAGRDFWDLKPMLLNVDGAAVRARRVLEKLIKEEQAARIAASESS